MKQYELNYIKENLEYIYDGTFTIADDSDSTVNYGTLVELNIKATFTNGMEIDTSFKEPYVNSIDKFVTASLVAVQGAINELFTIKEEIKNDEQGN